MRLIERPFSDLLRHPNDVTGDLNTGDVLLRRRDEPDLRLTLADRDADRTDAFGALARTFRNLAVHNRSAFTSAVTDAFSWVSFLPPADRHQFIDEFASVVAAAAELDNFEPMSQLVREWRDTAEVHANPKLARRLGRTITADGVSVPTPAG